MPGPSFDWLSGVAHQYHCGRPLALFFDYDGTLTPIVRHPSLARLSDVTRRHLQDLVEIPRVRVGIVSGRALNEVRLMVGIRDLYYAGSGGLDLDLRGRYQCDAELKNSSSLFEQIQDHLLEILRRNPGTWFERKPGAMAIHFRDLMPLNAACFRFDVASILAGIETVKYCVASQAIEITPRNSGDKGTAVGVILNEIEAELSQRPFPVYFGDSDNDIEE